jgi:hypothetical protein
MKIPIDAQHAQVLSYTAQAWSYTFAAILSLLTIAGIIWKWPIARRHAQRIAWIFVDQLELGRQLGKALRERDEAIRERNQLRASVEAAATASALDRETLRRLDQKVNDLATQVEAMRRDQDDLLELAATQALRSDGPGPFHADELALVDEDLRTRLLARVDELRKARATSTDAPPATA